MNDDAHPTSSSRVRSVNGEGLRPHRSYGTYEGVLRDRSHRRPSRASREGEDATTDDLRSFLLPLTSVIAIAEEIETICMTEVPSHALMETISKACNPIIKAATAVKKPGHLGHRPNRSDTRMPLQIPQGYESIITPLHSNYPDRHIESEPMKQSHASQSVHGAWPTAPHRPVGNIKRSTKCQISEPSLVSNENHDPILPEARPPSPHGDDEPTLESLSPQSEEPLSFPEALKDLYEDVARWRLVMKKIWVTSTTAKAMSRGDPQSLTSRGLSEARVNVERDVQSPTPTFTSMLTYACVTPQATPKVSPVRAPLQTLEEPIDCASMCGVPPYEGDAPPSFAPPTPSQPMNEELRTSVCKILDLIKMAREQMCMSPLHHAVINEFAVQSREKARLAEWHSSLTDTSFNMLAEKGTLDHFGMTFLQDGDEIPISNPPMQPGESNMNYWQSIATTRMRSGLRTKIKSKASITVNYDAIDPDAITHDVWNTTDSIDAPTADIYIKKFGSVPAGFELEEAAGKNEGELAAFFKPVKGVYFVKYNAMWFAEWHDLERADGGGMKRVRHRTRFSVQKYGHCQARALAVEKRAEADRSKNRLILKRNEELMKESRSSDNLPPNAKFGPTWTGLPEPEHLMRVKRGRGRASRGRRGRPRGSTSRGGNRTQAPAPVSDSLRPRGRPRGRGRGRGRGRSPSVVSAGPPSRDPLEFPGAISPLECPITSLSPLLEHPSSISVDSSECPEYESDRE